MGRRGCRFERQSLFDARDLLSGWLRLESRYPYLFVDVDARMGKTRAGGRVARKCVVIARGARDWRARDHRLGRR
jgi:hypothetical protein